MSFGILSGKHFAYSQAKCSIWQHSVGKGALSTSGSWFLINDATVGAFCFGAFQSCQTQWYLACNEVFYALF